MSLRSFKILLVGQGKRHNFFMATESQAISWNLINVKARVDAGSFEELEASIRDLRLRGQVHIALDLRLTRFFSLPAIQFVVTIARELKEQGGELVLVGPNEKTKKHIEVYGSLKDLRFVRDGDALHTLADFQAAQKSLSQPTTGA